MDIAGNALHVLHTKDRPPLRHSEVGLSKGQNPLQCASAPLCYQRIGCAQSQGVTTHNSELRQREAQWKALVRYGFRL